MPFADLLQWVSQSRKTGTLVLEGAAHAKKVYFSEGLVVAAASDNPKEFLGYYLVGWDFIGEEELQELLDMQERHGTLLGELLVIIGRMTREELLMVLQVKTEETVYELFLWEEGEFRFLEQILPEKKFQPVDLPIDMIIMEGVRRKDEWERCRKIIPDTTWIPKVVRAVDIEQMGERELSIFREITGTKSIEKIALECRMPLFSVLDYVFQGTRLALFSVLPPAADKEPIPGFTLTMWRSLLMTAELALDQGDPLRAQRLLGKLREQFPDKEEAFERAAKLEARIAEMIGDCELDDEVVLELAVPLAELSRLACSPEEGFLLSRVNGLYSLSEILTMVPGEDVEKRLMVDGLVRREILRPKVVEK